MTYDTYFSGDYRINKRLGTESTTTYSNFMYNGSEHSHLSESLNSRDNHTRRESMSAFIKAGWIHRNLTLNVAGGWNWERTPYLNGTGSTNYSPDIIDSKGYYQNRTSLGINPYLSISLSLKMPKSQTLSIKMKGDYASHNSKYFREPDNLQAIYNRNKDKRAYGFLSISYSKRFNNRNSLNLYTSSGLDWDKSKYGGSYDGTSFYRGTNMSFNASYSHIFNSGTSISSSIGFSWEHQKTGKKKNVLWNPNGDITFIHKWNKKSSMRISTNVFSYGYTMNVFNNVVQRQSELLWIKGNTKLKNRLMWQSMLSNTWIPSSNFSITPTFVYTAIFHHDMPVWERLSGYDGLVSSITDNSTVHKFTVGPRITLRLFNRKLVITGNAKYTYLSISGIYDRKNSFFEGSLGATWYGKNWYVGASIVPSTTISSFDDIYKEYQNWVYELRAGYNYKNLNIRFTAYNPFMSDLKRIRYVNTPHYSQRESSYSGFNSNVFTLQFVYTLNYGKKVSRSTSTGSQMLGSGSIALPR